MNITEHVKARKIGYPKLGLNPVSPSTILNELQHLKSVLNHARLLWGADIKYTEVIDGMLQLRKTRQINRGNHKEFIVSVELKKLIDLALSPKYRNRMILSECESKYLFPLRAGSISTEFNETCALLGVEDLRFHDLRHEGATRLAEKGMTIPQIQQYTLHTTWSSLQRYVSLKIRRNVMTFEEMLHLIGEM